MVLFACVQVHRWGSALPAQPFGSPCLTAESALLAACGDFCLGAGVENAVMSGKAAADIVHSLLGSSCSGSSAL
jgi:predicted NAD/FAD-dependent oxidoreductase